MFSYANNALTTTVYDATLIYWASLSGIQSSVTIHFGDAQYSAGEAANARAKLTSSTYNWAITDGGQVP